MLFALETGLAIALAYAAVTAYRCGRVWLAFGALLMLAAIAVLATGLTSTDGSATFLPPRWLMLTFVLAGGGVALGIAAVSLWRGRWRGRGKGQSRFRDHAAHGARENRDGPLGRDALVAGTVLLGFANLLFAACNRVHPLARLRQAHVQVLRVAVYDAATEEPIRGAEVRIFHPFVEPAAPPVRTDGDGIAVVGFQMLSHSHLFKGHSWQECILAQYVLEVRAEDYRPMRFEPRGVHQRRQLGRRSFAAAAVDAERRPSRFRPQRTVTRPASCPLPPRNRERSRAPNPDVAVESAVGFG